jgi:hypothetical protein
MTSYPRRAFLKNHDLCAHQQEPNVVFSMAITSEAATWKNVG